MTAPTRPRPPGTRRTALDPLTACSERLRRTHEQITDGDEDPRVVLDRGLILTQIDFWLDALLDLDRGAVRSS